MRASDLNKRLYDEPFRPFRIHLSDGTAIPVMRPEMLMLGESSVILPTEFGKDAEGFPLVKRSRTVALAHMVQFSEIDEAATSKAPKRKGR